MKAVRALGRPVISAGALLLAFAAGRVLFSGDFLPPADRVLLWIVVVSSTAGALLVWGRSRAWHAGALLALAVPCGMYLFEAHATLTAPPTTVQGRPTDPIEYWDLLRRSRSRGERLVLQFQPQNYVQNPGLMPSIPGVGTVMPLAGVANVRTLMCKEGFRPFAVYDSDEQGFNNPAGIWPGPADVVLVGDSFTFGACVAGKDHFVQAIRDRYPRTINLAYGGNGPLIELALIREYLPRLKPSLVFWLYDESNDVYSMVERLASDLEKELAHPVLRRYLENPGFSQGLLAQTPAIDRAVAAVVEGVSRSKIRDSDPRRRFLSLVRTRDTVREARQQLARAAGPPPPPVARDQTADGSRTEPSNDELIHAFGRIIDQAAREVRAVGARLVFVSIPALDTICTGRAFARKDRVFAAARATGADVIDLEKDFRNAVELGGGTEPLFAVGPCGGHFSEAGYGVMTRRIAEYLALVRGEIGWPRSGWQAGPSGSAPAGRPAGPLTYGGVDLDGLASDGIPSDYVVVGRTAFEYKVSSTVSRVLPGGDGAARRSDGAAILGYAWAPKSRGNILRVRVTARAWSISENVLVLSLFRDAEDRARRTVSAPVRAGTTAGVDLEYRTVVRNLSPVAFEARVGPERPGTIHINAEGERPVLTGAVPVITVEEWAPGPSDPGKAQSR